MPARKRSSASGSTRERVIQAADRLWGRRAVPGASLWDIPLEASVTKPTVYYYFSDKSALFTAVVCSVLEEHGGPLRTAAKRGKRARDRLFSPAAHLLCAPRPAPRALPRARAS